MTASVSSLAQCSLLILTAAEFFYLLFDKAITDPAKLGHGREGYYFVENSEHSLYDLCKAIGTALVEAGRAGDLPQAHARETAVGVQFESVLQQGLPRAFLALRAGLHRVGHGVECRQRAAAARTDRRVTGVTSGRR